MDYVHSETCFDMELNDLESFVDILLQWPYNFQYNWHSIKYIWPIPHVVNVKLLHKTIATRLILQYYTTSIAYTFLPAQTHHNQYYVNSSL